MMNYSEAVQYLLSSPLSTGAIKKFDINCDIDFDKHTEALNIILERYKIFQDPNIWCLVRDVATKNLALWRGQLDLLHQYTSGNR